MRRALWLRWKRRSGRLVSHGSRCSAPSCVGEARPDSDVDLLVEFAPGAKTFDRFLALSELLDSGWDAAGTGDDGSAFRCDETLRRLPQSFQTPNNRTAK